MTNLKIVYKTGQLDCYLYSFKNKETEEKEWRIIKEKPVKHIFINDIIPDEIEGQMVEDINQLCSKMEKYLKKRILYSKII